MSFRPLIFAAFANTRRPGTAFLEALDKEAKGMSSILGDALSPFEHRNLSNADPQSIWEQIGRYRSRIVAYHYGGHADEKELILMNSQGNPTSVPAKSLAGLLGTCPYLQLVFLNGCSTQKQVESLLSYPQIQYIIATQRDLGDQLAAEFALAFYRSLSDPQNPKGDIATAFESARSFIASKGTELQISARSRNWHLEDTPLSTQDWVLFSKADLRDNPPLVRSLLPFMLREASDEQFEIHQPKFNIDPLLLPRIICTDPDSKERARMKIRQDELPAKLQRKDSQNPNFTFILTGDGGTGKSTALKNLWQNHRKDPKLIPVFIQLKEINTYKENNSPPPNWILHYLLEEYLGARVKEGRLKTWLESVPEPHDSKVLLLLNGLDEVSPAHLPNLLKELLRFWFPARRVICLIGSRNNPSLLDQFNREDLRVLTLTHLWMDQIEPFLAQYQLKYPKEKSDRWTLLRNPMMLSHYAAICSKPDRGSTAGFHKEADLFESPETQEQLLWNFFELQIYNTIHYPDNPFNLDLQVEKDLIRWLFHFLIAHCGYLSLTRKAVPITEIKGIIEWEKEQLMEQIKFREDQVLPSPLQKIADFIEYVSRNPTFLDETLQTNLLLRLIPQRLPFVSESIEKDSYEFDSRLYGRFFAAIHLINCMELHLPLDPIPEELYHHKIPSEVVDMMKSLADKFPCEIIPFKRKQAEDPLNNGLLTYLDTLDHNLRSLMLYSRVSK